MKVVAFLSCFVLAFTASRSLPGRNPLFDLMNIDFDDLMKVVNAKDQTTFSFNSSAYSNWTEWGPCDPKIRCIQARQKECLDDSYLDGLENDCKVRYIEEKRICQGEQLEECLNLKNKNIDKLETMTKTCGQFNHFKMKIAGGSKVAPSKWPWFLKLTVELSRVINCGATLITPEHAVTAAHCLERLVDFDTDQTWINASSLATPIKVTYFPLDGPKNGKSVKVKSFVLHPTWREGHTNVLKGSDIAILKLETPLEQSPLCLPKNDSFFDDQNIDCWSAGYGKTSSKRCGNNNRGIFGLDDLFFDLGVYELGGFRQTESSLRRSRRGRKPTGGCDKQQTSEFREVKLPIQSLQSCERRFGRLQQDKHICAGTKGKDTCLGDSGGGLFCMNEESWFLFGVTSFGVEECGSGNGHSVYASIPGSVEWIQDMLLQDLDSESTS